MEHKKYIVDMEKLKATLWDSIFSPENMGRSTDVVLSELHFVLEMVQVVGEPYDLVSQKSN